MPPRKRRDPEPELIVNSMRENAEPKRRQARLTLDGMLTQPGYLVRRLHQMSTAAFLNATGGLDLTPIQFSALLVIETFPASDAATISNIIAFDRVTVGQVLNVLERKGLITREQSLEDRRRKTLNVTSAGARLIGEVSRHTTEIEDEILQRLTDSERATLMRLLKKLVSPTVDVPR